MTERKPTIRESLVPNMGRRLTWNRKPQFAGICGKMAKLGSQGL